MHHQGLSYVPEIIWTKLTSMHHDECTLASGKLEKSLPRNAIKTYSCRYQYIFITETTRTRLFMLLEDYKLQLDA